MWRLSIMAAMVAAVPAGSAPAPPQDIYADAIVMFGAHWCAPCMDELRHLPELSAAAAPDRILLAWIDRPVASSPTLIQSAALRPDVARSLAASLLGEGYGLPSSAMFDTHGRVCAVRRSPLSREDIARMRAQCTVTG